MNIDKPIVTVLCGSTRFPTAFELATLHLSFMGRIVIGLSCFGHAEVSTGSKFLTSDSDESTSIKQHLDALHLKKIDRADGIYVVNPGGYIGQGAQREIAYAKEQGKTVEYMFLNKDSELKEQILNLGRNFLKSDQGNWYRKLSPLVCDLLATQGYKVQKKSDYGYEVVEI